MVSIAIPQIGTLVPLFEMYKQLSLINSRFEMILLMASLITPFTVWTMISFIQQIPERIEGLLVSMELQWHNCCGS